MDEIKILSAPDAWSDFWQWLKEQPQWDNATRVERQYLDKTNRQMKEGKVGLKRLKNVFKKYAPGRYEFSGGFIIHK